MLWLRITILFRVHRAMDDKPFAPVSGGTRIAVRVQPRASRNRVDGIHNGRVKIRLSAPPVDNAANNALVEFLAKVLGVPKRNIALVRGHRARDKVVEVEGITPEEARRALGV